ncbi:hypothetical protein MA16_Dca026173 [Dendrobium catenatum]|uniref:Uncharacterized protein n=1 Tax=Dendrobium catenatum TaxID=906689 RepID=A0A2I0VPH6_9ASPA|nr:hypothetical protein MA16_Dca026173 [Dendrobium catenatum]
MADKERTTKSEIMRRMGRAVSDKVKAHILRKPTNDKGATRPRKKIQKRIRELYRPVKQHPEGRTSSLSNRGSKSRNTSRPIKGKVVQPKELVTVVTKEEPSTRKVQKQKERVEDAHVQPTQEVGRVTDPPTPVNDDTEMKVCEQYVPISPNHISGRSVDEILEELKASISRLRMMRLQKLKGGKPLS